MRSRMQIAAETTNPLGAIALCVNRDRNRNPDKQRDP